MKISKQRLKQIIKEELSTINELEQLPAEGGDEAAPEEAGAKSTSALAKFFLGISKKVQGGQVKGLDPSEIQLFAALIEDVIGLVSSSSASSQLKVLNQKVDQFKGSK